MEGHTGANIKHATIKSVDLKVQANQSKLQNVAPQEHTELIQVPSNSVPPGNKDDNLKNGQQLVSEEPIDSASIKGIFGWETVDDTNVPYILRQQRKFVPVRIVECKLLSKYPSTFSDELSKRDPLVSYFITKVEASLLNEINTAHCEFEYGRTPFTTEDLIVDLEEFEEFFKVVKKTFPTDILSTMSEDRVIPVLSPSIHSDLSQFCGWMQINNTVSPYIFRYDNGKQLKLVPLSVIMYAAGLLTNSSIEGLQPTPQECLILNEACRIAGFEFSFGNNTHLISISEVLHRCQVQLFELPFKNPLQHARYIDPCTGQLSSSPLLEIIPQSQKNKSSLSMKTIQGNMEPVTLNSYSPRFQQSAFHLPQMNTLVNISNVPVGQHKFHDPSSPTMMRQPRPHSRTDKELSYFPGAHSQTDAKIENNLIKQGIPGSLWAMMPRALHPAHINNTVLSRTPPVTPDPVSTSVYQPQSLPPNPLLHTVSPPAIPGLNHHIFRGPMGAPQRPVISRFVHKDLPTGIGGYPPMKDLPHHQSQCSNPFSLPVNQFDSSVFAKTVPKDQIPENRVHVPSPLSSSPSPRQPGGAESVKHPGPRTLDNIHQTTLNSHTSAGAHLGNKPSNNQSKPEFPLKISATLINGKSISCITLDLPHDKGLFCLVEAVSKLYFPNISLTEFMKVLEEVLKIKLHDCTQQMERAFVQYYNLPVNKLKCNKIIAVDDLQTYFPQLNYMFTNCLPSNKQAHAVQHQSLSPTQSITNKRRSDLPCEVPPMKTVPTDLENAVGVFHGERVTPQSIGSSSDSSTGKDIPVIVIDDE